jgi:predicted AAA+ superfamily ATPase
MLAHVNGQTANYSILAGSLGITSASVKNYIDLLANAYMVEIIPPYFSNLKKRLVKAPKLYIADCGITEALLQITSFDGLTSHPAFGSIWESVVLANIRGWYPEAEIYHYRTSNGAEIDFVVKIKNFVFAIECKASFAPALSKSNYFALEDIAPAHTFIVSLDEQSNYTLKKGIDITSLKQLKSKLKYG